MLSLSTRKVGNQSEDLACSYLIKKGYKILARNYTIRGGEIDIVAKFKDLLVIVEVKARYSHQFGSPQEAITPFKIKALLKTAQFYINQYQWGNRPYRFDLLAIDYTRAKDKPEIEHLENIITA